MDSTTAENSRGQGRDANASVRTEVLPFPVLRIDDQGCIIESNGVLEQELGSGMTSLISVSLRDIVGPDTVAEIDRILSKPDTDQVARLSFKATPSRLWRSFFFIQREGERWLVGQPSAFDVQREELTRAHMRAEAQNDEYARLSSELRKANADLDRRAQQLQDATETKARFLATMSHELRTPLNAVLGYAGLLRDGVYGKVSDQQDRAINSIVRRAKDLQLLIDDVLDLSKIEAGRMDLRLDEFDPGAVLNEVREEMSGPASAKHLSMVVRYDLRRTVRADRAKYKHVLLNVVSNAVKFTPDRGEIEISVHEAPDETFITRVRDTGIGIDPQNLTAIFHAFEQIESGTTRKYGGIGLGLSLARRTIEQMGGSIEVESAPGRGTTFTIRLPIQLAAEALAGMVEEVPAGVVSDDPVVLAIDDDPEVIALLRDSLAPAHFRVVGALNGDRGLELARIVRPFAITLDIMMPEKDGWQVLREIKSDAAISDIPVIIMSIVSERALGFSLGVTEYLVKPVDRRVLLNVLERLRKRQEARTALVVDGDYDARVLLRDLLESLGFRVRVSETADDAVIAMEAEVPDVLFVDLTMPTHHVGPLLERVSSDRRFESMRVVAVTRSDGVSPRNDWLERAAAKVVFADHPKPDELLNELRKALNAIGDERVPALNEG